MGSSSGFRGIQLKIGFSFGRCVRDIVCGQIKLDDVSCIIARTQLIALTEHLPKGDYNPVHARRVISVTGPEHDTVDFGSVDF